MTAFLLISATSFCRRMAFALKLLEENEISEFSVGIFSLGVILMSCHAMTKGAKQSWKIANLTH